MGHTKTTIELNGKLYDAKTGAIVHGGETSSPAVKKSAPKGGQVMDGFIRRPQTTTTHHAKPKPKAAAHRSSPSAKAGHTTQPSKTLMRHAVHKPAVKKSSITGKASPVEAPAPKVTQHQDRQQRATTISKSSSISRFSMSQKPSIQKTYAPLAVQPHPEDARAIAAPTNSKASQSFEAALQNATTHQQPPMKSPKRRHRAAKKLGISVRALNIGAVSLAVVLLAGFITYQNVPNVSMRLASAKAGFHANLPGYTPSGFSRVASIQSVPGAVTVSFRSHSDNRNFEVTQKPSNWTSDSLLENQVAVGNRSYDTYQDKGRTIYVYDGKAAWVNGGILYEIENNASLSSDQILDIADSL